MLKPLRMRRILWWCLLGTIAYLAVSRADIDVVVNLRSADAVSDSPPLSALRNFKFMSQMDNSDVFVALCTPGTFSPDNEGICHDCTVCRPGEQFERLPCVPVRDRTCLNCTLCSDHEIELCQCSVKTTQCVTGDRVCVKVVPTVVTLTIDLTSNGVLTSRQQMLIQSGMSTGYVEWLGLEFGISADTIEMTNFVKVGPMNYKATFTFYEVYGEATVTRINTQTAEYYQGGLFYTFGGGPAARRRRLLSYSYNLVSANGVSSSCTVNQTCPIFTEFQFMSNGSNCSGTCNPMCPVGYGPGTNGKICEVCAEGTYKDHSGNDFCAECPAGSLSPQGSNSSAACVLTISSDPLAASNLSDATTTTTTTTTTTATTARTATTTTTAQTTTTTTW